MKFKFFNFQYIVYICKNTSINYAGLFVVALRDGQDPLLNFLRSEIFRN